MTKSPKRRGYIRERIVRVLLDNPSGDLTKYKVAKLAGGAYSWVHEFLKELENKGMIKNTKVVDYQKIIALWEGFRITPDKSEYMLQNPLDVIKSTNLKYAITTYVAENMIQNYLFPSRTDFYINREDKEKWHQILSQKGLVGKGNTRVLVGDPHVFDYCNEKKGFNIVSVPQIIVDLIKEGGSCVEAAEMLIKKESGRIVSGK